MKIEIHDKDIETQSFRSKKDGTTFELRFQTAYAHIKNQRYPVRIKLQLEDTAAPYEPADYQLDTSSFLVDQYHQLSLSRSLKLLPMSDIKSLKSA